LRRPAAAWLGALLLLAAAAPRPAAADDTLTELGGSIALSLGDVLDVVADRAGFYKQQHLNVVIQLVNSPSAAAALVASGKGDICGISYEAVLQGYEKGLHLQYFFTKAARLSNVLAVLDDSPIRSLNDFKGKNIGVFNIGSAGEITAQLILAGAGLRKDDVTFSPIGAGAQALDAILNHRVDAIAYPYAEIVPMELRAHFQMRVWRHPTLQDVPAAAYASTPDTLASKADAIRRFARATAEAALFVKTNPVAAARMFLAASHAPFTDADVALRARSFVLLRPDLPDVDPRTGEIGALSEPLMQRYAQALADYGMTKTVVPVDQVITNRFIDAANDFDHRAVIALAENWPRSTR
jgi:NitT/TauT family transport system substrate-binding protein